MSIAGEFERIEWVGKITACFNIKEARERQNRSKRPVVRHSQMDKTEERLWSLKAKGAEKPTREL